VQRGRWLLAASWCCFWWHLCDLTKSQNHRSEINATRYECEWRRKLEVLGSWWHLTLTFDLESYFCTFSTQAIPLQWLDLATSFSIWRYSSEYLGHGSVLRSWIQVQSHGSEKAVACNSKTAHRKLLGLDRELPAGWPPCMAGLWVLWKGPENLAILQILACSAH